jgi:hypothetical protein
MGISNKTAQHRIQLALQVFCQISTRTGLFAEMHPITGLPDLVISHCASFFFVSIYNTFINNLTGLQDRVLMKINQINENPMVLEHVVRNGVRRQATLSLQEGAHFQHLS